MKLFQYEKTVYSTRTESMVVQVVDRGDQRELRFGNHITQSAMSLSAPDVPVLDYARAMAAGILFPARLAEFLHIGLGAGTLPRFFHRYLPGVHQRAVELHPTVVRVAQDYFDLPQSPRLEVVTEEGASFLAHDRQRYQLIFLDAFHADGVTDHLNTPTIYNLLLAHLERGGWLVSNQWGSDRANLERRRGYLLEVCTQLYALSVRANSNVIFFGSRQEEPPNLPRMRRRARMLSQRMPLDLEGLLARIRLAPGAQRLRHV